MDLDLQRIYHHRFDGISPRLKQATWQEIARWILNDAKGLRCGIPVQSVLDPACGDGEFLNACSYGAVSLTGCDLRDRSPLLTPAATFHQGLFQTLKLDQQFDLIWISNLLEHLRSPEEIQDFLIHCRQILSPNGLVVIMGPNIKYCRSEYWDFADHCLPLSHLTVIEHLVSAQFAISAVNPKFLPYSFRSRLPADPRLVRLYLMNSWAWSFLGKQFLIRAKLP
jgi:dolichol-phosphate mannosyltransferase